MIEIRPANAPVSSKKAKAPTETRPLGASGIEIRPKSENPYYAEQRPIADLAPSVPPVAPTPEMGLGDVAMEGAKGLARGTLGLAQSIGGAGVEMAGQLGAGAYDLLRTPQNFPGMTPEQLTEVEAARAAVVPTQNPLEGQGQFAKQVFPSDSPVIAPDPRASAENAPYLTTSPGIPQLARLAGEAGEMAPNAAATIGAAVATGGLGPAGALAGGAMGGGLEGLSEYQQVLDKGGSPVEALRAAAVMGAGAGALNAIPFVTYSTKFLPPSMRGTAARAMLSFIAEGSTETAEGGVSAIARMKSLPKSQEEWAEAYSKVERGIIDESNVFLVAGLMGGGTAIAAGGEPTIPSAGPGGVTISPDTTSSVDAESKADLKTPGTIEENPDLAGLDPKIRDMILDMLPNTSIKIGGKTYTGRAKIVPRQEAPAQGDVIDTTASERFEEDYAPFDLPGQEQAPTAPSTPRQSESISEPTQAPDSPVAPSPEAVVAPEPEPELSESEKQAEADLLAEFPELKGMLDAARRSGPLNDDLVNTILNADTVDSRDIPKIEVRKPVSKEESLSKLIEERPALDVGRPLDVAVRPEEEGVPQGPARATVRAQDRPRPGERPTSAVPSPEVRATVRGPEPQSKAVALPSEEPVMEAESVPFDLTAMPMEQIDAFMADEDAKMAAKESAVAKKYLTPEQQATLAKIPNTEYGQRLKTKMFSTISDEAADAWDETAMADDMETASRYRQVEMLREKLANFTGEDETEANKDLELFLRNANFDDPVDVRVLQELTQRYDAAGLDVNKMLRTARAAYGTWYYEQTRDPNEAMDMVASLDAKLGIPAQTEQPAPEAEFVGLQERPRGQAPIALYNIPTPDGGKTTVTAETAKSQGFSVPEPPIAEAEAPDTFSVIRYNPTTDAISNPATGDMYATIREVKKRNGDVTYEVKGYSKLEGKYPDLEGKYEARTKEDATAAAREIAQRESLPTTQPQEPVQAQSPVRATEIATEPEVAPEAIRQADARLPKPKKGKSDESGYVNMSLLNPMEALRILRGKLKDGKFIEFEQGFMGLKDLKVARSGKIKSLQMRGKLIAQDFENAWRKEWQKQNPGVKAKTVRFRDMPAETVEALNDYLVEEDAGVKAQLLSELPEGLRRPATQMRDLVDQMSQELIDMGIVEDDVQKVIADQMGFYLRRTYAIFQDPKYRENIPKAVEDNARQWLREKFPTYTTNQIESALADLKGVGSEKEALNRLVQMGGVLGKLDRRTLGKRNEYDQAILDLWGVDKNGIDNFLNTINAQAHMIANFEWLEDIKANGRGTVVLTPQDIAALPQGDEKAQWPFLNESDSRKAVSMLTRPKDPAASRSKALDKFIAKAESQGDAGTVEVLKKTKALFEKGMKLEDGKEVVDSRNLEGASKYAEQLQAEADKLQAEGVAAPRGKKGPLKAKSRVAQSKANKVNRQIKAILEAEEQKSNADPDTFGPFGPLAGARVHPEFKAALQEAVQVQEVAPWIQKWNWFNRQLKQNVTTRDPASALRNFRSGVDFSMANGWMLYDAKNVPKRLTKALSIANVDIRRSHDPELREEYLKMVEYGIAGDTAIVGELNEIQKEAKKAEFVKAAEKALSPELVKAMGGADALATKLYQAGDDVFKIFGALTEQEHLIEATGMDADAALKEAAARIRRQFPTYSEVHKSLQKLRRTPVLGPFVAYQSEVPRNAWNTIAQMATEIKSDNPKVRAMGYRRAAGIMWAATNRHAYKAAWLALLGLTPDDDDRIRKAQPEYFQGHEFAITEGDKATGKYRGYNLSQADAYGPLKEPFWAALRGENIVDAAAKATEAFGGGYVSPELGTQAIVSVFTGTDARGKDLFLETDSTVEKMGKTLGHVLGQYAIPSPIRRQFKAKSEEEHALEVFGTLTGYRFIDIDLPESLFWKAKDFKKYGTEQVRDAYTAARDGDTEAAKKQLKDLETVRKDYFDELQEAYIAFRDTGLNQEIMDTKLKEAGLSGKEIEAVKYGTLEPYTPPQKLTDMME